MNREVIFKGVRDCLMKVADIAPAAIKEDVKIIDEIGADSLDLLDLIFQLEQHFNIRIKPRDIERRAKEELGDVPMEIGGEYSPAALEQLKKAMPEVPPDELSDGLRPADLPRRFRVATFVNLVERMLEEQHG